MIAARIALNGRVTDFRLLQVRNGFADHRHRIFNKEALFPSGETYYQSLGLSDELLLPLA